MTQQGTKLHRRKAARRNFGRKNRSHACVLAFGADYRRGGERETDNPSALPALRQGQESPRAQRPRCRSIGRLAPGVGDQRRRRSNWLRVGRGSSRGASRADPPTEQDQSDDRRREVTVDRRRHGRRLSHATSHLTHTPAQLTDTRPDLTRGAHDHACR